MTTYRDFNKDLSHSWEWEDRELFYRAAYPDLAQIVDYHDNRQVQLEGWDAGIVISNWGEIRIEEKLRDCRYCRPARPCKYHKDIALEIWHEFDDGSKRDGWALKSARADQVAYVIKPARFGYLFSFKLMRDLLDGSLGILVRQAEDVNVSGIWLTHSNTEGRNGRTWKTVNLCVSPEWLHNQIPVWRYSWA